ncbi:MAG: ATP-dependent zinc protease family protein, partial [Shewanella sp.]
GCAMTAKQPEIPALTETQLATNLQQQQAALVAAINSACQGQQQRMDVLHQDLSDLKNQVGSINTEVPPVIVTEPATCPEDSIGEKIILGQVEFVFVDELQAGFDTRIDTGAESSSLDARNIILFERDGQQWVRFDVNVEGGDAPLKTFESKVERFVRIKGDEATSNDDRRPVITAHLQIGAYKAQTSLNLNNRSGLEYQLLLGRKFMKDIAVVDVSQAFLHGKSIPSPTKNAK